MRFIVLPILVRTCVEQTSGCCVHAICVLYFLLPVVLLGHLQCSLAWLATLSGYQSAMVCAHPAALSDRIAVDWQILLRVICLGLLQTANLAVCLLHQPSSTLACRRPGPCHAAAHHASVLQQTITSHCITTRDGPSGSACQVTTYPATVRGQPDSMLQPRLQPPFL